MSLTRARDTLPALYYFVDETLSPPVTNLHLPITIFATSPARQNATAAMPCANTANNGGV
jgi:hypothetical protein